ncbi:hypothetical protein APY04_2686 [Hyphomicrobium sulfonivorans]|uniref:Uncharacterized protein n=1 Tax=Hyphomicrobium sulfonivorans TaxID=121290 RepID=A0A109BBP3_HYPSL|nr:hypothetical protein [Hyphomicrobium sulfonivorans]KWT65839.1 hypothetical protein APY04_2686 [Hyphomicrobium sulfonivorans]
MQGPLLAIPLKETLWKEMLLRPDQTPMALSMVEVPSDQFAHLKAQLSGPVHPAQMQALP